MLDYMFADPTDSEMLWMGGVYDARAAIISFHKVNGNTQGQVRFDKMSLLQGHA